jgi:hypothetical protein
MEQDGHFHFVSGGGSNERPEIAVRQYADLKSTPPVDLTRTVYEQSFSAAAPGSVDKVLAGSIAAKTWVGRFGRLTART